MASIMRRLGFDKRKIRVGDGISNGYVRFDPKEMADISKLPWLLGPPIGCDGDQAALPSDERKPF